MTFAISLKTAQPSSTVARLWDIVGALESSPSMALMHYPPHLTLACYDSIDPAELARAIASVADEKPLPVRFERIALFENDPLVVYLQPAPLDSLSRLHRRIHASIDPALCDALYRPCRWVPHCTLGTRIRADAQTAARRLTAAAFEPFVVNFDTIDCVSFPPVTVLAEHRFEG